MRNDKYNFISKMIRKNLYKISCFSMKSKIQKKISSRNLFKKDSISCK